MIAKRGRNYILKVVCKILKKSQEVLCVVEEKLFNGTMCMILLDESADEDVKYLVFYKPIITFGYLDYLPFIIVRMKGGIIDTTFNKNKSLPILSAKLNFPAVISYISAINITLSPENEKKRYSYIIKDAADVYFASIIAIRDLGIEVGCKLLNANVCDFLVSFTKEEINADEICDYFQKSCNNLKSCNIFLAKNGQYISDSYIYPTSSKDLISLINNSNYVNGSIGNLDNELYSKLCNWDLLKNSRNGWLSQKKFDEFLLPTFLNNQTTDWILDLYDFYNVDDESKFDYEDGYQTNIRLLPIIKTQDGRWISAYDKYEQLNVYIPPTDQKLKISGINYIHTDFLDDRAVNFYQRLGIVEYNIDHFIRVELVSKYTKKRNYLWEQRELNYSEDFCTFLKYYDVLEDQGRDDFCEILSKLYILRSKQDIQCQPSQLYLWEGELYNLSNTCHYFEVLDIDVCSKAIDIFGYNRVKNFLIAIGVNTKAQITTVSKKVDWHYLKSSDRYNIASFQLKELGLDTNTTNELVLENYFIDGMLSYIQSLGYIKGRNTNHCNDFPPIDYNKPKTCFFNIELSKWIWESLISNVDILNKCGTLLFWWYYYTSHQGRTHSTLYECIKYSRWLLGNKLPEEVTRDELIENGYEDSEELCTFLGIKTSDYPEKPEESFGVQSHGFSINDL